MVKKSIGWRELKVILNTGFAGRCAICGGYFDEDGVCPHKHRKGEPYLYKKNKNNKANLLDNLPPQKGLMLVVCARVGAQNNQCNICGSFFEPGSLECDLGHIIGQPYWVPIKVKEQQRKI